MLLPALSKARESAKASLCAGNLRQLGSVFTMYTDDFAEFYPPCSGKMHNDTLVAADYDKDWMRMMWLNNYISNRQLLYCVMTEKHCPTYSTDFLKSSNPTWELRYSSYGYNTYGIGDDWPLNWTTNGKNPGISARYGQIKDPSGTLLLADCNMANALLRPFYLLGPNGTFGLINKRHLGTAKILWVDGHVDGRNDTASLLNTPYTYLDRN
jgi:prepilin-type processing-associated H-X9-DG protein